MQSSDEWGQNYYQLESINRIPELSFDQTLDIDPSPTDSTSSPKVGGGLFPKGSIGKPVRRRSRSSKRAPTTHLTADAHNFRALVQQFTGCHSVPPAYKGPINLNFEQANCFPQESAEGANLFSFGRNNVTAITTITTTTTTTTTTADRELYVTGDGDNSRAEALTLDDFDIDNLSIQDIPSGPGDYSTVLPGNRNDDLWGY